MKTVFWILVVTTVLLGYVFWFFIPQGRSAPVMVAYKAELKVDVPLEPRSEDKGLGDYRKRVERPKAAPVPPPPPPASVRLGAWLSELSKATPMVTCGLAVWTHFENKKRKHIRRKKHVQEN